MPDRPTPSQEERTPDFNPSGISTEELRARAYAGDEYVDGLLARAQTAEAELEEARRENTRTLEAAYAALGDQVEAREQAETALRRAVGALEFYADPESYFAIGMLGDPPCGAFWDDFEETGEVFGWQPGKRAREALASLAEFQEAPPADS